MLYMIALIRDVISESGDDIFYHHFISPTVTALYETIAGNKIEKADNFGTLVLQNQGLSWHFYYFT